MKDEQHFLDINTENKVFKRLSCNMLTLVLQYVIRKRSPFFAPKCSAIRDLGFHS